MHFVTIFGPFGWLIPALFAWSLSLWDWGCLLYPRGPLRARLLGGTVAALASSVFVLQVLFYAGGLRPGVLFGALCLAVATLRWARHARRERERPVESVETAKWAWVLPPLGVATFALTLTALSAYWLPIWQWDSLGYHLPFVNFVLQEGGVSGLPRDVPYLSTYPRNVELLFLAWRVTLPDDRLIDAAQIPFGLVAAAAIAGITRELGAPRGAALVAGAAFITMPAVFLQLPTNYIDVASASFFLLACYFVVAAPTRKGVILAGLAIGLFLGTKPSAPPAAAFLALIVLLRARPAGLVAPAALGVLAAGLLGGEAYFVQLVRHGNPVWPAVVKLGPLELPGTIGVDELLSSGIGAQKVHGSMPYRIAMSWFSLDALPTFDMRVGGLGAVFWVALPLALAHLVRRRSMTLVALLAASLTTPDPAVARYILPFPGLLLALAASETSHWLQERFTGPGPRRTAYLATLVSITTGLGAQQLWYAFPGLSGEGPPLFDYAGMSWPERERAVGANGVATPFIDARQRLEPGDLAVYDRALWLPYLMWRSDASNRVLRVPDGESVEQVSALLDRPDLQLIAVGHDQPAQSAIRGRNDYEPLFQCREPCTVYRKD